MTTELLPCPFCGDDQPALDHEADTGAWSVRCTHCGITIGNYAGERSALSAWSRRASATTPTEGPAQTLTDEQIDAMAAAATWRGLSGQTHTDWRQFARAIESKVRASTLTDPEGAS